MSGKTYITEADFIDGMLLRPVPFDVPGLGLVEVRGLSTLEFGELQTTYKNNPVGMMLAGIEIGLTQPKLSEAGVKALHNGNPGHANAISTRILELSGQGEKEAQDPLAGSSS